MWLMMNDAFLSVVHHRDKSTVLLVRARVPGDIESVFPNASVWEDREADYNYRAEVSREEVSRVIGERIGTIDYPNFKNSVAEPDRARAYSQVWETMLKWAQTRLPFRHNYLP